MPCPPRHALLACVLLCMPTAAAAQDASSCCADLEERIAELEQTAATKGNRKVSLMVSGQVNKAMTFWDDGEITDAYVVDNDFAQSRIRFQGKAEVAKGWEVGYWLEFGLDSASSDSVSQFDSDATAPGQLREEAAVSNCAQLAGTSRARITASSGSAGARHPRTTFISGPTWAAPIRMQSYTTTAALHSAAATARSALAEPPPLP